MGPRLRRFPTRHLVLAAIVLATLLLRGCHLRDHLASPLGAFEEIAQTTDCATFAAWAKRIAAGDWLCRNAYHPYFDWMERVAPKERFLAWWGGPEVYHQNPLYPYLLAVSYTVFGSSVGLLVLQVLASAFGVVLLYDLGRRLSGPVAGLCSAALGAVFAPSIVLDTLVLRASLNSSTTLLSVWALVALAQRPTRHGSVWTGACLAAGFLLRPTGLLLLLAAPLLLLVDQGSRRLWRRWLPGLLAGVVVVMAPFVTRNAVVGAPLLRFSTRGPETVIQANSREMEPGFMTTPKKEDFPRLLDEGHASLGAALATSIRSWPESHLGWWLWHMGQKLICVLRDYEYMDNLNFEYFRARTPVLRALPTFGWIVGLGLVGLVLLPRTRTHRGAVCIFLVAAAGLLVGCVLGFALGRYRMPLAVLLTVPAGIALTRGAAWVRHRRVVPLVLAGAVVVAVTASSYAVLPARAFFPGGAPMLMAGHTRGLFERCMLLRAEEHCHAARGLVRRGDPTGATRVLDDYLAAYQRLFQGESEGVDRLTDTAAQRLGHDINLGMWRRNLEMVEKTLREFGNPTRAADVARTIAAIDKHRRGEGR